MRHLGTLAVLVVAGVAWANVPPPPSKVVSVEATVKLDKEIKGFVLFFDDHSGKLPKQVDLSTEKATAVPFSEPADKFVLRQGVLLLAVPEDLAPKLKTADDWKAARDQKNSPILSHGFSGNTEVRFNDDRKVVQQAFVVKGIDAKTGLKVEEAKEVKETPNQPPTSQPPKKPISLTEPGYLIGAVALAVGVTLGGMWVVRRRK